MAELKKPELKTLRDLMDAFKMYIPYVEQHGVTPDLIRALIKDHEPVKQQLKYFRDRYEASKDGVPILTRIMQTKSGNPIDTLVNNKLNNAFDADVIDSENGYLLGLPINYATQKDKKSAHTKLIEALDHLRTRDNVTDKDATWGKRASVGGYGARLCYIGIENDKPVPRILNLRSEEVIFIYNETMAEPTYALHYYNKPVVLADGTKQNVTVADFYDNIEYHRFEKASGDFVYVESNLHGFDHMPIIGLENDDELMASMQKVLNLIDAYDRTMSDASNEIEASRLAILILENLGLDENEIDKMRAAGILEMWGEKTSARYLTKDVNDQMIENALNRYEKNVMRFAKAVDFTDEQFSSNLSGIAIAFKTMALENKAITKENKMRSSLQYQMKVLCSAWARLGICKPEDYLDIFFNFKRNLPVNKLEMAQIVSLLKGIVSDRTLLSLLPFVDDIEAEIEAIKQDQEEFGDKMPSLQHIGQDTGEGSVIDEQEASKTAKKTPCPECSGSGKMVSDKTGKLIICRKCGGRGEIRSD